VNRGVRPRAGEIELCARSCRDHGGRAVGWRQSGARLLDAMVDMRYWVLGGAGNNELHGLHRGADQTSAAQQSEDGGIDV
jgi:hypothetical protein